MAVALLAAPGCAGDAFEAAPGSDAGVQYYYYEFDGQAPAGGRASLVRDANAAPSDANDASVTEAPPSHTPCGIASAGTAPTWAGEKCLPAASFTMGSDAPNLGGDYAGHIPPHPVALSAFFIDEHEVTVARYRACVERKRCAPPPTDASRSCTYTEAIGEREEHPVTCVAWQDAAELCTFEGRRLPTEAEWEFAARGAQGTAYPWGEEFDCSRAALGSTSSCPELQGALPKPVGSYPLGLSEAGVADLAGNAAEWVADWAGSYSTAAATNPTGPEVGSRRIVRGGSWQSLPGQGKGFIRSTTNPESWGHWGFRCARDKSGSD